MFGLTKIAAAAVTALIMVGAAAGSIPRSHYWTVARAAVLVRTTVKIPCAKLTPNPNHLPPAASCATQPPSSIAGATVGCVGKGTPLRGARRFNRFLCNWRSVNDVSYGSLLVYVSGASTFRWKVIT